MEKTKQDSRYADIWESIEATIDEYVGCYNQYVPKKDWLEICKCKECRRDYMTSTNDERVNKGLCHGCGQGYGPAARTPAKKGRKSDYSSPEVRFGAGVFYGYIYTLLWLRELIQKGEVTTIPELADEIGKLTKGLRKYPDEWFDEVNKLRAKGYKVIAAITEIAENHKANVDSFRTQYYDRKFHEKKVKGS